jgi:ferredoxin-NADP reductase/MOSC domain-containing protein YiiM
VRVAKLRSINVGLPKDVDWRGRRVYTGIWKSPVDGARVRRLNVDGDGQGDVAGHGGEQRAVFVYQTSAYDFWSRKLQRTDFVMGQFGENFTVDGLEDDVVRVGDRFRIGSATFEITQPRVTCYRVGIRLNDPEMPARLVAEGLPGFYFRVLEEGDVRSGDPIELVSRNMQSPTVAAVDALLYRGNPDRAEIRRALAIDALSPGWRTSLQAILDRAPGKSGNPGLAKGDLSPSAWPGFRAARIADLAPVADGIVAVGLEAADRRDLPTALPGQFLVLKISSSPQAAGLMRSYSISGTPTPQRYELGVKCEPGGAMGSYLSRANAGDDVEISAPRGSFVLSDSERAAVFVSAGIGVTPVLAMLKTLAAQRSQRSIWWLYGARNRAEHPFRDDVLALLSTLPHAKRHVRYSRPAGSDRLGDDYDSIGHIDETLVQQLDIDIASEFYLCGPAAFMADVKAGLLGAGATQDFVFSEAFGTSPALTPGIASGAPAVPHIPGGEPGNGPAVAFSRAGLIAPWSARYSSLLDFAEACDVPTRWSCRIGVCHTCETALISGDVRYEPMPLQSPARGNVLLCCSKPVGDVVLDL